jgi:integrase/recombinase XerD
MRRDIILHSTPNTTGELVPVATTTLVAPQQAESDQHLIDLWLHGRSRHTQRAYRADAERFFESVGKPLHRITLGDLQAFSAQLVESGLEPSSVHRSLSAVKSLFAFGHRLGYLPFDVARPLRLPALRDGLADRILEETDVVKMIALEQMPRNRAILLTLYAGGFRVAELCSLKWSDLQSRDSSGQITVFGKGGKTRTVLMPQSVWNALQLLRKDAKDDAPVFRSRKGGHLDESQVWRIVRKAAKRAGIEKEVSCHWLRHAHASHALDRGAPIHLVQATLGHSSVATTGRYLHARPTESSSSYLLTDV